MTTINRQPAVCDNREPQLDKGRVARSFSASCGTYEEHASVQRGLADHLAGLVAGCDRRWRQGLEIGCGTGYLSWKLVENAALEKLYLNDLAPELCSYSAARLVKQGLEVQTLAGDIETLTLPAGLDLVISSSTLQWIEDLDALFAKIAAALAPGGLFAFSLFGAGTMGEISELSGRGLKYMDFSTLCSVTEKYFMVEQSGSREDILYFPTALALFRHIRNTGVGGLGQARWTRAGMKHFEQRYRHCFGTEKGLPVSYCAHYFLVKHRCGSRG